MEGTTVHVGRQADSLDPNVTTGQLTIASLAGTIGITRVRSVTFLNGDTDTDSDIRDSRS